MNVVWGLLIVLAGDASGFVRVSWHESYEACAKRAEIETTVAALNGVVIESMECRRHRMPTFRDVDGRVVR